MQRRNKVKDEGFERSLMFRWIFIILITCCISACGFKLRGNWQLPNDMQPLFIASNDPYGQLVQELKSQLQSSHFDMTQDRDHAKMVLAIESDHAGQKLLGVNTSQQTRQYALLVTVHYSLQSKEGQRLIPPESIQESRTITVQSNQVLGSSNEIQLLNQDMRRSIALTMLNRLSSASIKNRLEQNVADKAS